MNHGSHKTYYCPTAKTVYSYKYTKDKLHKTNAITWFYKKGVHCVNKLIPTSLCEFASTTVVCIRIMHGSRIIQYLQCSLFLKIHNFYLFMNYYHHHHSKIHSFHCMVPCKASGSNELTLASWLLKSCWQHCYWNIQYLTLSWPVGHILRSIAHSIICTVRLFCGKMHSEWFNGIDILQGRWQHGEKVGYCYPSGLEKTLCKWEVYVPLVTKGLNHHSFTPKLNTWNTLKNTSISMVIIILHLFVIPSGDSGL
jgi:hypothetical protein